MILGILITLVCMVIINIYKLIMFFVVCRAVDKKIKEVEVQVNFKGD